MNSPVHAMFAAWTSPAYVLTFPPVFSHCSRFSRSVGGLSAGFFVCVGLGYEMLTRAACCFSLSFFLRVCAACLLSLFVNTASLTQPLEALHLEDDIQLVFFHPQYAFR